MIVIIGSEVVNINDVVSYIKMKSVKDYVKIRTKPLLFVYTGAPGDYNNAVNSKVFPSSSVGVASLTNIMNQSIVAQIHNETDGGSITPTTFRARGLIKQEDSSYFLDTYTYGQNSVIRFGLNVHSQILQQEVNTYNQTTGKAKKDKLELKSLAGSSNSGGQSTQEKLLEELQKEAAKMLLQSELANTQEAIKYLKSGQKAVLVDIFARDADNNVKSAQSKNSSQPILETHTVVLYEQAGKYLVIDPSNASFSTILIGVDNDIRICSGNKCQIYKPAGATSSDDWRDCVDVAVKLAFSLIVHSKLVNPPTIVVTEFNKLGHIDFLSLKEHPSIIDITNNPEEICKKLPSIVAKIPLRLKQSSDILVDKKVTAALKTLDNVMKPLYIKIDALGFNRCKQNIERKLVEKLDTYNDMVQLIEEFSSYTDAKLLEIEVQGVTHDLGGFV